ncbi:hypothetical protein ACFOOK_19645 [Micromonospora krabiensis]|uniref:Uncharacterized protein n=1 Tax=Micromonospora krabiensis TaxID=307121 RepID=A0A1C3N9F5_9ACTN|nr:hypothetical protein [Micromonospora krabiensis]SBV29212.1 hypothetical protein GA0070620_4782 [Micromonospora krabiensis]
MSGMWWARGRNTLRRRRRHVLVLAALAGGASWMIWQAARHDTQSFTGEFYLNIGAALIMTLLTYVVLNPLFRELQTASIIEHPRLDRDALIERVARSRELVAILETWTSMLEGPYARRFVAALRSALANGASVRMLLLDPDSPAVRLRGEELRRRDASVAILNNLWHLARLHEELPESARSRLEVRIYTAAPSVQMYRWDSKAFISFFPVQGSTFDTQQIEAFVSTPLGEFVDDRFAELWETAPVQDLAACLSLRLCLRQGGRDLETCEALYVRSDGDWYIAGTDLVRNVARHGLAGLSVVLDRPEAAGEVFTIGEADELPPEIYNRVLELFRAKYGLDSRQDTESRVIFNLASSSLTTV